jgi:F420-0:gamma-glutamyl ligase-like protein
MNTQSIQQPPTFTPPPQNYLPPTIPSAVTAVNPQREQGKRINVAFFAAVAFFVLSHPMAYRVMNHAFTAFSGSVHEIITESGAPTMKGHFLHSVVFFCVILFILMRK